MDKNTGWPDAKFLRAPTANKVIVFLHRYIADHGTQRKINTDPGIVFTIEQFKIFWNSFQNIFCGNNMEILGNKKRAKNLNDKFYCDICDYKCKKIYN